MDRMTAALKPALCLILAAALLCGCRAAIPDTVPNVSVPQGPDASGSGTPGPAPPPEEVGSGTEDPVLPPEELENEIDDLLREMSLAQKVGQLFIVRPDALDPTQSQAQIDDSNAKGVTQVTEEMAETLARIPVGGVVLFSKNISDPQQLSAFIQALQSAGGGALFVAVDEEGGAVARLANNRAFDLPRYSSAAAVGAGGEEAALEMGRTIGAYLKEYGFNLDFAPVADVDTDPRNHVIGKRAFSSDPEAAAVLAAAMAEGLREQGIIPTFKHFPGHGSTAEDSHSGTAVSRGTREEMALSTWLPFAQAGSGDCVMVGHISVPDITGDLTPATLSPTVVTDILRVELGFEGLVVTDSLTMGAITNTWTAGEAAVLSLQAGCDLLLMPQGLQEAFDAVLSAVENGTLSEERIDESVRRILTCKAEHGILVLDDSNLQNS